MDVNLAQDGVAGVYETMRCVRGDDYHAAGSHIARFVAHRDRGRAFDDEGDFDIGMRVEGRALSGLGRDDVGGKGAPWVSPTNSCDIPAKGNCSRLRKVIF